MRTRVLAALLDCNEEREGPAAVEPVCLHLPSSGVDMALCSCLIPFVILLPMWRWEGVDEQIRWHCIYSVPSSIPHHHLLCNTTTVLHATANLC